VLKVVNDPELVAYCGLYCGACKSYRKEKCPGCHDNVKAGWCTVRVCCNEHGYATCAECEVVGDVRDCKKLNNVVSKLFALVFRSDRPASLDRIGEVGIEAYAAEMAESERQSVKRR
jgi:hypothetical protein